MEDKVKLAIKGNEEAFSDLINEYKDKLYLTAYAYVKNKEDALDIVSDTVYKAYISIDKLKEPKYFKSWLTRILINNAISFINKNNKVIYLEDDDLNNIEGNSDNSDERLDILNAIERLDEKYRKVIILKYFDDLTISEISRVLDMPEGTVKTYLNKGLSGLRVYIRREIV